MKSIKFIHCADIHLDSPFKKLRNGELATVRRNDIRDTFLKIINLAYENKVDMLLVSGDLFEHSYSSRSTMKFINEGFSSIDNIPVVIISGNHDPYIINSYYKTFEWSQNVHILNTGCPCIHLPHLDAYIYGLGFESFKQEEVAISSVQKENDSKAYHILLFHGTVDMNFGNSPYNPVESSQLEALGMDYIALGHFHKRKEDYKIDGAYNPGSPEPLGFDEQGVHGVFYVELAKENDNIKRSVDFLETAKRTYNEFTVNVTGCMSTQEIKIKILNSLEGISRDGGINRIILKGFIDRDFQIRIKELEEYFNNEYFYLDIQDKTYPDYDLEEIKKEPGLKAIFTTKMLERIDRAKDQKEKEQERKALYLGLEAIDKGRLETLED